MKEWFKKAKLGLFIHYGIYAVKGVAESWSFYNGQISYEEYMEQAEGFTASKLDMKDWAELAVIAGAKYTVFTTKHHDGMALFDTDVELDVYNLGLIYEINLDETGLCKIVMTFTDTACDCAESLPIEIVAGLKQIEGIEDVKVEVTWSPAWKITRISRYGRIALGLPPR